MAKNPKERDAGVIKKKKKVEKHLATLKPKKIDITDISFIYVLSY